MTPPIVVIWSEQSRCRRENSVASGVEPRILTSLVRVGCCSVVLCSWHLSDMGEPAIESDNRSCDIRVSKAHLPLFLKRGLLFVLQREHIGTAIVTIEDTDAQITR